MNTAFLSSIYITTSKYIIFFFWPEKSIFREIDILEKTILCEVMTTASAFVLIRHPPKIRLNGHLIIVLFKNTKFEKNGR